MRRSFAVHNHFDLMTLKPSDIEGSEPANMGALLAAMAREDQSKLQDKSELFDEIDEYFRLKFRKLSFKDGKEIVKALGVKGPDENQVIPNRIDGLDDKFWVWETLEEATRGSIS